MESIIRSPVVPYRREEIPVAEKLGIRIHHPLCREREAAGASSYHQKKQKVSTNFGEHCCYSFFHKSNFVKPGWCAFPSHGSSGELAPPLPLCGSGRFLLHELRVSVHILLFLWRGRGGRLHDVLRRSCQPPKERRLFPHRQWRWRWRVAFSIVLRARARHRAV